MDIDLTQLSPAEVYSRLVQTVVPRPVAWVLSQNADGGFNLAPFSYFNAVCTDPPLLMLSIGFKADGSEKDTRVNIRVRGHFVIHIAHKALAGALTETSATLPAGDSELTRSGLATTALEGFPLPRLTDCRVAFACECHDFREIGNSRQALILGRVTRMYVDESTLGPAEPGKLRVAADKLDPIGRLGGNEYTTFGQKLVIPRPK